jgi:hypothetical protein
MKKLLLASASVAMRRRKERRCAQDGGAVGRESRGGELKGVSE